MRAPWDAHDVRQYQAGIQRFRQLTLAYEAVELLADIDQMLVYTAEPSSPSLDALHRLAHGADRATDAEHPQSGER